MGSTAVQPIAVKFRCSKGAGAILGFRATAVGSEMKNITQGQARLEP